MKRILLVEDDPTLAVTLRERLEKENYAVVWCNSLAQANDKASERFDLIVLDVGLPDGSGFDFARRVRAESSTPFIFVTAQIDAEARLTGYEIGAEEYIPKPFHLREFLLRVRHVLDSHARSNVFSVGDIEIDFASLAIRGKDKTEFLPARDAKLLQCLIGKSPAVVSRDEVLDQLWGEDRFPTARTIDNSVLRLRQQLGPWADCIQSVRGIGYRWDGGRWVT